MIPAPELDYVLLLPLLIVAAAALVGVLVEAFCPRGPRFLVQTALAGIASVGALVASIVVYTTVPGSRDAEALELLRVTGLQTFAGPASVVEVP